MKNPVPQVFWLTCPPELGVGLQTQAILKEQSLMLRKTQVLLNPSVVLESFVVLNVEEMRQIPSYAKAFMAAAWESIESAKEAEYAGDGTSRHVA